MAASARAGATRHAGLGAAQGIATSAHRLSCVARDYRRHYWSPIYMRAARHVSGRHYAKPQAVPLKPAASRRRQTMTYILYHDVTPQRADKGLRSRRTTPYQCSSFTNSTARTHTCYHARPSMRVHHAFRAVGFLSVELAPRARPAFGVAAQITPQGIEVVSYRTTHRQFPARHRSTRRRGRSART